MDYITVPSSYTSNYTFDTYNGSNTYFVTNTTYFSATVTFSPGCIIKFNGNYLLVYGSIVCNGTGANPSLLTSYHENLWGENLPGAYSACPTASAAPALWDYYINGNLSISYMRFRWAQTAIKFDANGCSYKHTVSGCTFEECQTGIYANNCDVTISASTKSDVSTPSTGTGCYSFTGSLTEVGIVDSDGNHLLDNVEYAYFGRLGTLPGHIVGQTLWKTDNKSPSTDQPIWSTRDDATTNYVYNSACWLSGVTGLQAFSPWNSHDANHRGGTLITPRHVVLASHVYIPSNNVIRFVGSDGITYSRTCLASTNIDSQSDYMVMVLNTNLPSTVGYVKVLPEEVVNKMTPNMQKFYGTNYQCISQLVPAVAFNQTKEAYVTDVKQFYVGNTLLPPVAYVQHSQWFPSWGAPCYNAQPPTCSCEQTAGDSGSPLFVIINNELVLIGPWYDCGVASWQGSFLNKLNQKIADLDNLVGFSTGYSATVFSVTNFPSLW